MQSCQKIACVLRSIQSLMQSIMAKLIAVYLLVYVVASKEGKEGRQ